MSLRDIANTFSFQIDWLIKLMSIANERERIVWDALTQMSHYNGQSTTFNYILLISMLRSRVSNAKKSFAIAECVCKLQETTECARDEIHNHSDG